VSSWRTLERTRVCQEVSRDSEKRVCITGATQLARTYSG
jgi:hypothetical protein